MNATGKIVRKSPPISDDEWTWLLNDHLGGDWYEKQVKKFEAMRLVNLPIDRLLDVLELAVWKRRFMQPMRCREKWHNIAGRFRREIVRRDVLRAAQGSILSAF